MKALIYAIAAAAVLTAAGCGNMNLRGDRAAAAPSITPNSDSRVTRLVGGQWDVAALPPYADQP